MLSESTPLNTIRFVRNKIEMDFLPVFFSGFYDLCNINLFFVRTDSIEISGCSVLVNN